MVSKNTVIEDLKNGKYDDIIENIYVTKKGSEEFNTLIERLVGIVNGLDEEFKDNDSEEVAIFSAPGRTEIGGNHTDHQLGSVLAGSVNYDIVAAVQPNSLNRIRLFSEGYGLTDIELDDLDVKESEKETTASLIRGMAHYIKEKGYPLKGFDAYVVSNVPSGSGISSSAAFEVLLGNIINELSAGGEIDNIEIAKLSQLTENNYFGKPSGLMDQMASSVGGIVAIDFADKENPVIEKVDLDLDSSGYKLIITDSHSSHEDLTSEYAAIPEDMKEVADYFDKEVLSQVDENDFYQNISGLREKLSDRAVLRALHYFNDTKRAKREAQALKDNDFDEFLRLVNDSGKSSILALQNITQAGEVEDQAVALALALSQMVLDGEGASRVHGGGFAGTIQAFVPMDKVEEYVTTIDSTLGDDSAKVMSIRPIGGTQLI